eukprot:7616826-Karenia_brevis.AAC.1
MSPSCGNTPLPPRRLRKPCAGYISYRASAPLSICETFSLLTGAWPAPLMLLGSPLYPLNMKAPLSLPLSRWCGVIIEAFGVVEPFSLFSLML